MAGLKKRVLAIDIGNSNIVLGLFEGEKIKWVKRVVTDRGLRFLKNIRLKSVDGIAVASVVPALDSPLKRLLKKKFGLKTLFVSSRIRLPIRLKVKRPSQVGADRIANAVAAYKIPPGPPFSKGGVIVIDFGTATTFDVISEKGDYLGGPIAPGIGIANAALHEKTAKLPLVRITRPPRVIGRETRECIQAGVLYGYAGLVEGLIARIRKEYGKKMRVIATGGLAPLIVCECCSIQDVDSFLTLRGLKFIYEYNV